ncbi:uncharacterized protein MONOS_736 [Monocercomonoides exilis]|uniref:uncharacterized protein n=1 Tax=Monocercomonoides exilis TaxID=2049356 RepID=UPI00355A83C9|nr:hypothetical protein MONOS_736 [Monocercomonoides exilis]|eukprot:MONOS_736.1-p1 / transcript=MONOS_736.1 / gene=MONOS_736 / organism=Monocercomonoides_exilis_PA203 / gene_product=unspecified product / transcript_product=unspecified product / location=Mono_scaffold00012:162475-163061(-) / protein_length=141 / sequence_SO=supercontig / SO=protein_coding / is_pseudo=false
MSKPSWYEDIEERLTVRNYLQAEFMGELADSDSATENAWKYAEMIKKLERLEEAYDVAERERRSLAARVDLLENGPDNIYDARKERDEYKEKISHLEKELGTATTKHYIAQTSLNKLKADYDALLLQFNLPQLTSKSSLT